MSRIPSDAFIDWPEPPPVDKPRPPWRLSLIEMLVVIGIIGVTVGFLMPAVTTCPPVPRRKQCLNHLRQIGLALQGYHKTHGVYPPRYTTDANGRPLLSWRVLILPYLDNQYFYEQFNLDQPWDGPDNWPLIASMPSTYRCPNAPNSEELETTIYQLITGPGTPFDGGVHSEADIPDGTSRTLFAVEAAHPVHWTAPLDLTFDPTRPDGGLTGVIGRGPHPTGWNAVFLDGSSRHFPPDPGPGLLRVLATRDGGELIELP